MVEDATTFESDNVCYRVWFTDGSAVLVDAEDAQDAMAKAEQQAEAGQFVKSAEFLY